MWSWRCCDSLRAARSGRFRQQMTLLRQPKGDREFRSPENLRPRTVFEPITFWLTTETEKGLFGRILGTGRGRNRRAAEANAAVQSSIAGSPGELHTIRRTANRTRGCERLLNPRPVDLRSFRLRSIRL